MIVLQSGIRQIDILFLNPHAEVIAILLTRFCANLHIEA
jgi:hypothetical protein